MTASVLDDPRARDLLASVPDDAEQLAGAFRRAAEDAEAVGVALAGAADEPAWRGAAADAFRRSIARLPDEMTRILDGYGAVARALDDYAAQLVELRAALTGVLAALDSAEPARRPLLQERAGRILDVFESAREECRQTVAVAQGTAPVVVG